MLSGPRVLCVLLFNLQRTAAYDDTLQAHSDEEEGGKVQWERVKLGAHPGCMFLAALTAAVLLDSGVVGEGGSWMPWQAMHS